MNRRTTGQFYGDTNQILSLEGLTVTDTVYTLDKVDWHYHEQPYFTFILDGTLIEGNKKEVIHCQAGSLLFHNWQDPHFNIKPPGRTRGFHIELDEIWLKTYDADEGLLTGSTDLKDPRLKQLMYQVFKEVKIDGPTSQSAISALLLKLLHIAKPAGHSYKKPQWVNQLKELLHDENNVQRSLKEISQLLSIHPVHLSAQFSKYFQCGLGEYIRGIRMGKALRLLPAKKIPLTQVALTCGFADQSHFNRTFKAVYGLTPLQYRRLT